MLVSQRPKSQAKTYHPAAAASFTLSVLTGVCLSIEEARAPASKATQINRFKTVKETIEPVAAIAGVVVCLHVDFATHWGWASLLVGHLLGCLICLLLHCRECVQRSISDLELNVRESVGDEYGGM